MMFMFFCSQSSLRVSKPPDRYTDLDSVHTKVQLLVAIHDGLYTVFIISSESTVKILKNVVI